MSADEIPRGKIPIGPDSGPEPPFPLFMEGPVISGEKRGGAELGIPTANLPVDTSEKKQDLRSGIYFGYAALALPPDHADNPSSSLTTPAPPSSSSSRKWHVFPMVMSIGYNPYYGNAARTAEAHVAHRFAQDFYGVPMRLLILGFVRDEKDYAGVDALIADIKTDRDQALTSLGLGGGGDGTRRPAWVPDVGVWSPVLDDRGEPTGRLSWVEGSLAHGAWLVRDDDDA